MAHTYPTTADTALAQLPTATLRDEAQALAWFLFQSEGYDLGAATVEAVASIGDVLAYAAAWDAAAAQPAPEPEPTPAERKALWYAAQGVQPVAQRGGWLVPSGTRAGVVHFVSASGCTCEAGQHGRRCWHIALVAMQTARKGAA